MSTDSIPARLLRQAIARPDQPAYAVKVGGAFRTTSWADYVAEVRRAARAMIALGLGPGSCVSILGTNRPEWTIFDLACMCVGGAPAGIYTTCSPSEVAYIVRHSESPLVLVENEAQWKKVQEKRDELPNLKHVITMRGAPRVDDPLVLGWEEFLAKGNDVADAAVDDRVAALEPGGLATLIYTSGTTGPPKGVMLSHDNLAWTANLARDLTGTSSHDLALSYLPLSHIAEQMFSIHAAVTAGYTVYFAESVEKLAEDLKLAQPTVFFGVPRVWEKLHAGISAKLVEAAGVKKHLVAWARGVATRVHELKNRGEAPAGLLAAQYGLADKLIYSKLKAALGLGRARVCVSGAAPISPEVIAFFFSLDLPIREVYGQSEGSGPTSFNLAGRTKVGSVGPALEGVTVKIADDGEILVRGRNVFLGYYKEPDATAETLVDGWLCSGDLGAIDAQGFLSITGRKKEIIITAGGKNITPKNIEAAIKNCELVSEAVVIGDRRKYLTALVTLDDAAAQRFLGERGASGPAHEHPAIQAAVQQAIDQANAELARVEQVKRFTILSRQLGIDTGELTPTLKVKRKVVNQNFASQIEAMYAE
ncbi:MAG: long-chain fatty acid--CoA ligase [Polyangiaceae bacterium]|nr:long-chain fatty acid--CoA ligase [Polyangiaceae bacterium]